MSTATTTVRVVVLASGFGSNLQAIIDAVKAHQLTAELVAVISDRSDAYALTRARAENIKTIHIDPKQYPSREAFDCALGNILDQLACDLIVLAGFMRILSAALVNRFPERIMNIHPSLLPRHKGLHTHQRVLQAKDEFHGATVHFVTPELDDGPMILQKKFKVSLSDTITTLEQRVHQCEHEIYPQAIQMFADGALSKTVQG